MRTTYTPPQCGGGHAGRCPNRAVWSVRQPGDSDRNATLACGQHLHFAADEITGGEQCALDLHRIACDER